MTGLHITGFLLDTNCISELVRPIPDPHVLKWLDESDEISLYLSVLTLGEIRKGLEGVPPGKKRTNLEVWLEVDLQLRFAGRILGIDWAIADAWGRIAADAKRKGRGLSIMDTLDRRHRAASRFDTGLTECERFLKHGHSRRQSLDIREKIALRLSTLPPARGSVGATRFARKTQHR